jgi:hypothetical protein
MSDIKLTKDKNEKCKVDVTCSVCKRSNRHLILSDIELNGSEDMGPRDHFYWHDVYQIVQCQGCETIAFRKTHSNSEDYQQVGPDDVENSLYVDIFPNPEEGRSPVEDYLLLPSNLQRIYSETLKSLNSGLPILTGIGIRAIVETVCKENNATGNDLYKKINDLVTQGVLTKDGSDILQKLRTLGNKAAHEVKPHDNVQLGLALDVIDHLLQGVYILPHHAKTKFK